MDKVAATVRRVVELLVSGDYDDLDRMTGGRRLKAEQLREAVEEYGRKLCMPPAESFRQLDVIEVAGAKPQQWSVVCDLWTETEGRSDLSLELTVVDDDTDLLRVEIDNLHVL